MMSGAILHRRLANLKHPGPRIASVVLAGLVAAQLLHIGFLLPFFIAAAHGDGTSASRIHIPAGEPIDIDAILAAHLFGAVQQDVTTETGVPAPAQLTLTGTIASSNPKRGAAIISDDGKSAMYATGADLGGAAVYSVYVDRVILKRGGTLEVLYLPRAAPESINARRDIQAKPDTVAQSEPTDPQAAHGPVLANVMRVGAAESTTGGHLRGFHIFPGRDRATFLSSGLHAGDLVVAVNGALLHEQNPMGAQDAFRSVSDSARATLTVERFGQVTDVTIDAGLAGTSETEVASTPATSNTAAR